MSASSRLLLAATIVLAVSAAALAQTPSAPAWGTSSESSEVVSAWDMQTADFGTAWQHDASNNYRYLTTAGTLFAGLHVPNGAVIDSIELDACDSSTDFQAVAGLLRSSGSITDVLAFAATGTAEADGCSRWPVDLLAGETVDTQTYQYTVYSITGSGFDGTTTVGGVRVYYHLQVSPAPGTATFGDVPTNHPFFQFVEALASSGITAGCGNGNFCPDAPLTRGQMAVFLSKALGLHWPTQSQTN